MTTPTVEEIIKEAASRFLGWKLPNDFAPDCGIEFQKEYNVSYNANQGLPPSKHEPIGTNLFDAQQAEEMVRYILEDSLTAYGAEREAEVRREAYEQGRACEAQNCRGSVADNHPTAPTDHYKCQSYFDSNKLVDCTCGKCTLMKL